MVTDLFVCDTCGCSVSAQQAQRLDYECPDPFCEGILEQKEEESKEVANDNVE